MIYQYFRGSIFFEKKDMLSGGFDHFLKREAPCCIVRQPNNRSSLWGTGVENTSGGVEPKGEPLEGEIVESYKWNFSTGATV